MHRAVLFKQSRAILTLQRHFNATTFRMSNPGNLIGGHKANLNNPNTSDEAKQHSRQIIDENIKSDDVPQAADQSKNSGNIAGGLKATVNNPNVSDEAKQSAKERLNEY